MKQILNLKREQFHVTLEKQKRDQVLKSKRKISFEISSSINFNNILNELMEDKTNFEHRVDMLIHKDETMNNLISALSLGYNKHIPAMIFYNLSLSQRNETHQILLNKYVLHEVLLRKTLQEDDDICLISLGGISNLIQDKEITEYFLENRIIQNLTLKGNQLIEIQNFGVFFSEIINFFYIIFENVRKYRLENRLTFQLIFDVFRIAQKSIYSNNETLIIKMFKIIEFCSYYLMNLIEFLEDNWFSICFIKINQWLVIQNKQMLNICCNSLKSLLKHNDKEEKEKYKNLIQSLSTYFNDVN